MNTPEEVLQKDKNGRQLALNFMVNQLQDYAREHGLKLPDIDKELLQYTI